MKSREKTVKVNTSTNLSQMDNELLALCRQNGEFHKAYLDIEMAYEKGVYEDLQERIAALEEELKNCRIVSDDMAEGDGTFGVHEW